MRESKSRLFKKDQSLSPEQNRAEAERAQAELDKMIISPKERFKQDKKLVEGFNDLMDSTRMQAAMDAAFLEFTMNLPLCNDMQTAAANGYRTEGARRFLTTLQNLNADSEKKTKKNDDNLNHGT